MLFYECIHKPNLAIVIPFGVAAVRSVPLLLSPLLPTSSDAHFKYKKVKNTDKYERID